MRKLYYILLICCHTRRVKNVLVKIQRLSELGKLITNLHKLDINKYSQASSSLENNTV